MYVMVAMVVRVAAMLNVMVVAMVVVGCWKGGMIDFRIDFNAFSEKWTN